MSDDIVTITEPDEPEENWDPSPAERTYYRRKTDHQLGWMVRREGKDCIRLDRAAQDLIEKLDGKWELHENRRPLGIGNLAQICFEADKALCRFLGMQKEARANWVDLSDDMRIAWMRKGPVRDPLRRALYVAIKAALGDFTA